MVDYLPCPVPAMLEPFLLTPPLQRLKAVGMNCGCEYTSFPRFVNLPPYTRYDHSLGVARILWHFTADPAQTLAGLLHDIATPAFAHSVDFLHGDYLRQESTEEGTARLIASSRELCALLEKEKLTPENVWDYHLYPIADNDSPRLSADRLEYTLGNGVNYGFCTPKQASRLLESLDIGTNEEGNPELCFRGLAEAEQFGLLSLRCSRVYASREDRYAMQRLSELLGDAIARGILEEKDLYTTEPQVIEKLQQDPLSGLAWQGFRQMSRLTLSPQPEGPGEWRQVFAKKRVIDPLVSGKGRLGTLSQGYREEKALFLSDSQQEWMKGE